MFTTIKDADRIAKAQASFEERVRAAASESGLITLGFQGGGSESMVHYVGALNFWIAIKDTGKNRYWNALGTGNPFSEGRAIVAEINPPKTGINRRVSGAFVEDNEGKVYLAHRGRVGGGRKGIGKKAFMNWYVGETDFTIDEGQRNEIIPIGALNDAELLKSLAAFTYDVETFKEQVVIGSRDPVPQHASTEEKSISNKASAPQKTGSMLNDYGFSEAVWTAAKTEAKSILIQVARRNRTIAYSELADQLKSIELQANDQRLFHLLGEISIEENAAGRGMLSAIVVHKSGDMKPGPGFFELAKSLGKDTSDVLLCWVSEFNRVQEKWMNKK